MSARLKKTEVLSSAWAHRAAMPRWRWPAQEPRSPRWKPAPAGTSRLPMDEIRNDLRHFLSQPKFAKEVPTCGATPPGSPIRAAS